MPDPGCFSQESLVDVVDLMVTKSGDQHAVISIHDGQDENRPLIDKGLQEAIDNSEKAVTSLTITLSYDPLIRRSHLPCSHPLR